MHELSLAEEALAIVENAARDAGARRVREIILRIGRLSCVDAEALAFAWASVAAGGLAEGARLLIEHEEGRGRCRQCGGEAAMASLYEACPACGGNLQVIAGTAMRVSELAVE